MQRLRLLSLNFERRRFFRSSRNISKRLRQAMDLNLNLSPLCFYENRELFFAFIWPRRPATLTLKYACDNDAK